MQQQLIEESRLDEILNQMDEVIQILNQQEGYS